ncbi:MAG TPA: sulfotransferase [Acidimicrobiia bacterium]
MALVHPDWVRRLNLFGDVVGDPRLLASLDPDELLASARASTGLDDLGEHDWPGWTETYRRMVTAIDDEARLHALGRVVTRAELLKVLQTWLRLQRAWTARPAIRAEAIDAPLFVVGPPRTGTTILLELLALDPQLRAPFAWEALHPLREEGGAERRRELSECEQEFWADIHPDFMTMHDLASDLPCECVHFLMYDFAGPYWSMLYDTPSFTGWQLENLDMLGRVYRLHRRMLQTFQHAPGIDTTATARRWLLKSPGHLSTLAALFAEYPDARVIHTHRDPRRFIASLVSLLAVLRFMRSDRDERLTLGPIMEMTYQLFLEQVIAQRSDGTVPDDQIVDTHFLELMSDPVAMLRRVYEKLGYDWPKGHDRAITGYLDAKPKAKHGAHTYSFADLGLDEAHVRATFAPYVAHYGITEE